MLASEGRRLTLINLEIFIEKNKKIIYQNVKQMNLYQVLPCLRLYMLHSGHIQQKTSTIFFRTPDINCPTLRLQIFFLYKKICNKP